MILTKHYKETLTLQFNPDQPRKRYVHVEDNVTYKGVSTVKDKVLAKDLTYWAAKCAGDYLEQNLKPGVAYDEVEINRFVYNAVRAHTVAKDSAADSGSFVHDWLHKMVRGDTLPYPQNEAMANACKAAENWYKKHNVELVLAETPVVSRSLKMAGTPDLICYLDGKLTIVDWKTGKNLYYGELIQLAFYAIMFEEEFGIKIEQLVLVNASIKSPFKVFRTLRVAKLKLAAKCVHKLYQSMITFEGLLEKGSVE